MGFCGFLYLFCVLLSLFPLVHSYSRSLTHPITRFPHLHYFLMRALLLFGTLASLLLWLAAADASCDCYETSTHEYFTEHLFHDFRTLPPASPVPALPSGLPPTLTPTPANYNSQPDIGVQQAGWIQSDAWSNFWGTMNWGKVSTSDFPVRMQNSFANVYVGRCRRG